ncbi:MAG: bifunctional DNA-formamidopyrimidine glycosylase/DNA-(apurinic or apyrimidinic site) lyase [Phycisphaerales bacterium]|nr:bifunctional DNA-formamidopyrimidine glycosylase/DNA-(apurinic or apyrimidinic site) lyase [Phycisphaerales bacterium]
MRAVRALASERVYGWRVPELPEVECIRAHLHHACCGGAFRLLSLGRVDIVGTLDAPRGVRGVSPLCRWTSPAMRHRLFDSAVLASVKRKGKQLALVARDGRALLVRLGMTGQLLLVDSIDPTIKHVHASWAVRASGRLRFLLFRDPRRFGSLIPCCDCDAIDSHWDTLGPDALSVTAAQLAGAAKHRRVPLKVFLLDQSAVSGLGNIYVDESLFLARLHPRACARSLADSEWKNLVTCFQKTLKKSIRMGGSTLRDYRTPDGVLGRFQHMHHVYGRSGELCTVCKAVVEREVVGGRTTSFCPMCQNGSTNVGK